MQDKKSVMIDRRVMLARNDERCDHCDRVIVDVTRETRDLYSCETDVYAREDLEAQFCSANCAGVARFPPPGCRLDLSLTIESSAESVTKTWRCVGRWSIAPMIAAIEATGGSAARFNRVVGGWYSHGPVVTNVGDVTIVSYDVALDI